MRHGAGTTAADSELARLHLLLRALRCCRYTLHGRRAGAPAHDGTMLLLVHVGCLLRGDAAAAGGRCAGGAVE